MKAARLSLDLFRIFRDLARSGSFSRTAGRNFLTQSAVSQQIASLERHFGRRLLDRGRGRVFLTDAGEALLEGCGRILDAYEQTAAEIRHPGELGGFVRVETVYSIGLHHLAAHVKSFLRLYPRVNLHVEYNRSDRIYSETLQGGCDLGIVAYPWAHPLLRIVPYKKERLALVCPAADALARKRSVRLGDLERRNFIAFDRDIPTRQAIDALLRKAGVFVNVVHEFDNIETIKRSVEVGAGISILPENTVAQEVRNKALACVVLSDGPFYRPTGILLRKGKALSRPAKTFLGLLIS